MKEAKQSNHQFGIFDVRELKDSIRRDEILKFIAEKKCVVFILDDEIKHHEVMRHMQKKACFQYAGMAIIVNGVGMEKFKDTFHRSCSYVDQRMISYKDLEKIFVNNKEILFFWKQIREMFGEFQVKGMGQIIIRNKIKGQVEEKVKEKIEV